MSRARLRCASAHVFDDGARTYAELDRVVLDVVMPVVMDLRHRGLLDRFFFIRYGEGGLHVRVRLFGEHPELDRIARPLIETHLNRIENARREHSGPPRAAISLAWQVYAEEFDRYGGPAGIEVAEELFQWSSEYALAVMRGGGTATAGLRLGKALLATLLQLRVFGYSAGRLSRFAASYAAAYLPVQVADAADRRALNDAFHTAIQAQGGSLREPVAEFHRRFSNGRALTPELDQYAAHLRRIRERLRRLCKAGKVVVRKESVTEWRRCLDLLVPSYVHMTNNRLGVTPIEEAYLAIAIANQPC